MADRGVGSLVIAVRGAGQQPHPVVARQFAGARIIRCHPAAVDVSWQQFQRRIDLTVGQEVRVAIAESKQPHAPENTHRESGGHLTRGEREAREPLPDPCRSARDGSVGMKLKAAVKVLLAKRGLDCALAPDGPRAPRRRSVAPDTVGA